LKEDGPASSGEFARHVHEVGQLLLGILQALVMRDLARSLEYEREVARHFARPIREHLAGRHAIEGAVDLHRVQAFPVVLQHSFIGKIFGIKTALPTPCRRNRSSRPSTSQQVASVDGNHSTRDMSRGLQPQEKNDACDVLRISELDGALSSLRSDIFGSADSPQSSSRRDRISSCVSVWSDNFAASKRTRRDSGSVGS